MTPSSLYPAYGAFMSARAFQQTTGVQHFHDAGDLHAKGIEPDEFFYGSALNLMAQEPANNPFFMYVYLAANHFPLDCAFIRIDAELERSRQQPQRR